MKVSLLSSSSSPLFPFPSLPPLLLAPLPSSSPSSSLQRGFLGAILKMSTLQTVAASQSCLLLEPRPFKACTFVGDRSNPIFRYLVAQTQGQMQVSVDGQIDKQINMLLLDSMHTQHPPPSPNTHTHTLFLSSIFSSPQVPPFSTNHPAYKLVSQPLLTLSSW